MLKETKIDLRALTAFLFAGLVVYGNALHSPFIWDDQYLITDNHFIKNFAYIGEIFKHHLYYSTAGLSNFYRPMQTFFLMFDYALWKNNPVGYHVTNLLFHIACAFSIYLVIQLLFKKRAIAFMVGLIFTVHPVNSTVVDYISSRADSQAALFALLSVLFFSRAVVKAETKSAAEAARAREALKAPRGRKDKKNRIARKNIPDGGPAFPWTGALYIASVISFIMALLSKEMGVIVPALILAALVMVYGDKRRWAMPGLIPFLIIFVVYGILRSTVLRFQGATVMQPAPLFIRLLTTAEAFIKLMWIMFVPVKIHIEKAIPFSRGTLQPSTLGSLAALAALGLLIRRARRHSAMFVFGFVWFFVALIPMTNIVPLNTTLADHWLYLPFLGFFLAIIGGAHDLIARLDERVRRPLAMTGIIVYGAAIVVFSVLTMKQNMIWEDAVTFYRRATVLSPRSYRPYNELGIIYMNRKELDKALESFKRAIELNPNFDQAYDNLGTTYDMKGDFQNAVAAHKKTLELNPYNIKAYNNLGNAYNNAGKLNEAIEAYQNALRLNPDYKAAYNNLGVVFYKKGMVNEAKAYWQKVLAIDPDFAMARENLRILDMQSNPRPQ